MIIIKQEKIQLAHWHSGYRVCQRSGRPRFNPKLSHNKNSKMFHDATLLNSQHYKVRIKGKWNNSGKELHLLYTFV